MIHYFSEIAFRRVRRKLVFFWGKIKSAKEIKFALDVRCGENNAEFVREI